MARAIGKASFDLIVAEEVSSEKTYRRKYERPEWPGGASGITVAIGYDLGYATREKIAHDWNGRVPASMVVAMQSFAGIHGEAAHARLSAARAQISIPWEAAIAVFAEIDVPEWTDRVCKLLPNTDKLTPDCLGVIVSLAYNRGASFNQNGDRYREMRAIKAHMAAQRFDLIPGEFRSMKRLWPTVAGLQGRREREAVLFERGLRVAAAPLAPQPKPRVPAPVQTFPPAPPVPPKKIDIAKTGTTTGVIVAGGEAARQAYVAGMRPIFIVAIVAATVAVAAMVFLFFHNRENSK